MTDVTPVPPEQNTAASEDVAAKLEEYKIGWQRAVADYQNLKKEVETRRTEWALMSKQQILDDFIPVYDNFKTAFSHNADETNKQWRDGIGHIMKQFGDVLKSHGIEEIKTVGEQFDPSKHETVGEEESDGKSHGTIVREVTGGYQLGGKVVKPARVIIAK